MSDFALSDSSRVIFRSRSRFARIFVSFSTISMSCCVTRFLKMTISSTRFRNSGRNWPRRASITRLRRSSCWSASSVMSAMAATLSLVLGTFAGCARRVADGADAASATEYVAAPMDNTETLSVRALLLGERLETRGLERDDTLATNPFTLRVGRQGIAFLFRYGVAVFARLSAIEEDDVLRSLRARVHDPLETPETDQIQVRINPTGEDQIEPSGAISLE